MRNYRVLIVDDEFLSCKIINKLLDTLGYEATYITDPFKLIEKLDSFKPDILLLDLNIPGKDGFTIIDELKHLERYSNLPIIMLSADSSENSIALSLDAGAIDYLIKPVGKVELNARISSVIRNFRLKRKLQEKNRKLAEAQEVIERELDMAKKLQLSISGPELFENGALRVAAKLEIANKLGGDFYDIKPDFDGGSFGVVVDVSGHGVSSALVVMMIKSLLDSSGGGMWTPSEVLDLFHQNLFGTIPKGFYAAMNYFTFDKDNIFTFASAGLYDLAVLRKGSRKLEFFKCRNFAVGFIKKVTFQEVSIQLNSGDKVVIHTDGIHESVNDDNEMFGLDRFYNLIGENGEKSPEELISFLFNERDIYTNGGDPVDDATVMILEVI